MCEVWILNYNSCVDYNSHLIYWYSFNCNLLYL